jgi:hypothetical protein
MLGLEEEKKFTIVKKPKKIMKLKPRCACSFVVTIDMQCIPVVINSYINLKTYSITFINCLDKIV